MPVFVNYMLLALWLLMGWWIARGAFIKRPVRGGMVQATPQLRNSWPYLAIIWIALGFVLFAVISPY
jgi:hypothetical protein